ncbi:uncharacterized protein LOC110032227 [Phalaenopsis equestris]|uniref:uncharacterized protein LOC110032227 n=1 Tax=Phalaenopsis equestris TaxID=78828 RepID=UPI0009E440C3|nr:uncharacterized protein LOC110032227 [Phalaenopsis equestris]XP_020591458.1 uncharacterized protein LOC110032227 [Phalaenopsis equestris]XP_020591465.1 uncharacterized protein LOC110032227 [Phalaenopsis equestris]
MDVVFNRMSYWLLGTKDHEITNSALSSSPDFPSGFLEPDSVKFGPVNGFRVRSSSRRFRRERREERRARIDREYDAVIVPSDGGCLSGSESDDSDWSIGWLEPHASDFQSEADDDESSFAVLVPCYGRGRHLNSELLKNHVLGAVNEYNGFSSEGIEYEYIQRWLSSA